MKHVPLAALEPKIIRPGFEKHLRPLLMYRGAVTLGRAHRMWNLVVSGMEHEATISDITQRLQGPNYSNLCCPEKRKEAVSLYSFLGRLSNNPAVMGEMAGLAEYVDWLGGFRPSLCPVSEITHRSRHVGAGGWRTFVDDRFGPPPPAEFSAVALGKSVPWAAETYGCSDFIARRWFSELGLDPVHGNIIPLPDDFTDFAAREINADLQARYEVSYPVIRRWRALTGVERVREKKAPRLAVPRSAPLAYPFLIHDGGKPEHDLLRRVNAAVPHHFDANMRADICQDLIVGILCGDFSEDDLYLPAKEMTKRVFRMFPDKYGPISLDAIMPGTDDFRLIDTLADEGRDWA